jgi:hypothetical protein
MSSDPAAVGTEWPSAQELHQSLFDQLNQIVEQLAATPDPWFEQRHKSRSRVGQMLHGWHDEAKHSGEMYLLWKLCRANRLPRTSFA